MEVFSCVYVPLELVVGLPNYSFDTPLFPDTQSVLFTHSAYSEAPGLLAFFNVHEK